MTFCMCVGLYDRNQHCIHISWNTRGQLFEINASLVNVSLKFKTFILQIHCYFLLEKCGNLFQQKIAAYLIMKSVYTWVHQ